MRRDLQHCDRSKSRRADERRGLKSSPKGGGGKRGGARGSEIPETPKGGDARSLERGKRPSPGGASAERIHRLEDAERIRLLEEALGQMPPRGKAEKGESDRTPVAAKASGEKAGGKEAEPTYWDISPEVDDVDGDQNHWRVKERKVGAVPEGPAKGLSNRALSGGGFDNGELGGNGRFTGDQNGPESKEGWVAGESGGEPQKGGGGLDGRRLKEGSDMARPGLVSESGVALQPCDITMSAGPENVLTPPGEPAIGLPGSADVRAAGGDVIGAGAKEEDGGADLSGWDNLFDLNEAAVGGSEEDVGAEAEGKMGVWGGLDLNVPPDVGPQISDVKPKRPLLEFDLNEMPDCEIECEDGLEDGFGSEPDLSEAEGKTRAGQGVSPQGLQASVKFEQGLEITGQPGSSSLGEMPPPAKKPGEPDGVLTRVSEGRVTLLAENEADADCLAVLGELQGLKAAPPPAGQASGVQKRVSYNQVFDEVYRRAAARCAGPEPAPPGEDDVSEGSLTVEEARRLRRLRWGEIKARGGFNLQVKGEVKEKVKEEAKVETSDYHLRRARESALLEAMATQRPVKVVNGNEAAKCGRSPIDDKELGRSKEETMGEGNRSGVNGDLQKEAERLEEEMIVGRVDWKEMSERLRRQAGLGLVRAKLEGGSSEGYKAAGELGAEAKSDKKEEKEEGKGWMLSALRTSEKSREKVSENGGEGALEKSNGKEQKQEAAKVKDFLEAAEEDDLLAAKKRPPVQKTKLQFGETLKALEPVPIKERSERRGMRVPDKTPRVDPAKNSEGVEKEELGAARVLGPPNVALVGAAKGAGVPTKQEGKEVVRKRLIRTKEVVRGIQLAELRAVLADRLVGRWAWSFFRIASYFPDDRW
jgi:hypothetical protein